MILINPRHAANQGHRVVPTRFPDGTSQVWKLPDELFQAKALDLVWYFQEERELFDLFSLRMLLGDTVSWDLYIPYLPYARQDKLVSNEATFNFSVFARLLNELKCEKVSSYDVHNRAIASTLIDHFENIRPDFFHRNMIKEINPDFLVYPDLGASARYLVPPAFDSIENLVCEKVRHPLTGEITGQAIDFRKSSVTEVDLTWGRFSKSGKRYLILDDICDGGATFTGIAKTIQHYDSEAEIHLAISHGIFSRGRAVLENAGIRLHPFYELLREPFQQEKI